MNFFGTCIPAAMGHANLDRVRTSSGLSAYKRFQQSLPLRS